MNDKAINEFSHNTAFIFVIYDPQTTHGKQVCNRKQDFLKKTRYTEWNKLLNNLNFPFGK